MVAAVTTTAVNSCGNDDGGYRGNDDDATATATTISAYITNTNKFVKTVVSVADGDSGISGVDGMQGKGPVALMYKKKQTSGVSL